jgi:RNA polymerase sigma-70 factor (ECF subfamily)
MKNVFINNYRKSLRECRAFDNIEKLPFSGNLKESQLAGPDSDLEYKQINDGINELDDEFKIPFRMHVEGYKYKEIAENLNLKIGTVKSRIFLTRKKLMEKLYDYR